MEEKIKALWERARNSSKDRVEELENSILLETAFIEKCEERLKED